MLEITLAVPENYEQVRDFYYNLIEGMEGAEYSPGWEKDIYPTQDYLRRSIENNELYIGHWEGKMVSCMVVNHEYNEQYRKVNWQITASDEEILVIHILGVHHDFSGRGLAKQMAAHVIGIAKRTGIKALRLDVLGGNLPAEKAYRRMGFCYVDTIPMYYEDTGWTDYLLFELLL